MNNQRGFSLFSLVFIGAIVLLGLAYGRPFFSIPYNGYKIGNILSGLIREGNTKEFEIKKIFDERVAFEKISDIVSSKDITVTNGENGITIQAEYEHCASLWKHWSVCAQMNVQR